ncbi:MAG: hypothetical protein ACT4OZ_08065 [Gemmatimonadota bacterium]
MANFVALVDPDADRRAAFLRAAIRGLAPFEGLDVGQVSVGRCAVAWAASPRAPVDHAAGEDSLGLIWGEAGAETEAVRAQDLVSPADHESPRSMPAFDGFFAALRYSTGDTLSVGADIFGLFPVYYASAPGVVLVSSSPGLFGKHPLFPARVDLTGLVGVLAAHAALEQRSVLAGVSRLSPGHTLVWSTAGGVSCFPNFDADARDNYADLSFAEQMEMLDYAYRSAVARQIRGRADTGLLLSGGRDTRMLAGYMHQLGLHPEALTFGSSSDYEVVCARAVAGALGQRQHVRTPPVADLPAAALRQVKWEHLGTGFSNVHMWSVVGHLDLLPPRFVTGYLREVRDYMAVAGGLPALLGTHHHRGFQRSDLERLLRPQFRELAADRFAAMQRSFDASSRHAGERAWRFQLGHAWRAHAGGVPWRLTFGSWPILPILDRSLFRLMASLPDTTMAGRRTQDEILRTRFPQLARLPLDRNSDDTIPLLPTSLRQRCNGQLVQWRRLRRQVMHTLGLNGERRWYVRTYDPDGDGWRRVRTLAEPFRERLFGLFDADVLKRWLPAPDVPLKLKDPISDGFRPRLLLGLMLLSSIHEMPEC